MPKILLTIFTFFICLPSIANMASPIRGGTKTSSPFISQHVNITHENILIIPDEKFETAQFIIEYHIHAEKAGKQIPLLFYALDFLGEFRVWLDGQEIPLRQVPEAYEKLEGKPFIDFKHLFQNEYGEYTKHIHIDYSPSNGYYLSINDLKFFETDLAAGDHTIKVEYIASCWTDDSNWVRESSFRYTLSPAKYWKSFGTLNITLDASRFDGKLNTSLRRMPATGDMDSVASWTFSSLPTEVLQISYVPEVNTTAKTLIAISPEGLTGIFAIVLILLHFLAMRAFRKHYPTKRFSWVMIVGSILVPFLAYLAYLYSFEIIDSTIGEHASRYHGYTFLAIIYYPFVLAVYWPVMWLVDRTMVRKKA